ncbi:MAG: VWA domain-containing protein, partial [Betaproteobacteria bacterium]|nr:VWA domain-containing protein [Betaproteobacteria bacterium]
MLLLPTRTEAVMLVMDSSGSMRADDVKPSRLHAAQAMAREFV